MSEKHWPVRMPNTLKVGSFRNSFNYTRNNTRAILFEWIPWVFMSGLFCLLAYLCAQQVYRQTANDPQIQIAEDVSAALAKGTQPSAVIPQGPAVDVAHSLSTFIIVYNASNTPLGSNVVLDGNTPTIPTGISTYLKTHNQDRVTWQPRNGVRIAAVAMLYGGATPGYVVVGRSLRESEARTDNLGKLVFIAFVLFLVVTFILALVKTKGKNE